MCYRYVVTDTGSYTTKKEDMENKEKKYFEDLAKYASTITIFKDNIEEKQEAIDLMEDLIKELIDKIVEYKYKIKLSENIIKENKEFISELTQDFYI